MRIHVPCTALGLALAAAAPAAHAQTVIAQPLVSAPPAMQTVRTVTTVRTVRRLPRRRVAVTRHTYVSDRVVPAATTTTIATPVAAAYPPLYDYVTPAPDAPAPYYSEPLYDTVVTTPAAAPVVGAAVPFYRYVYQPDRILVIDPTTGIAMQAIPR